MHVLRLCYGLDVRLTFNAIYFQFYRKEHIKIQLRMIMMASIEQEKLLETYTTFQYFSFNFGYKTFYVISGFRDYKFHTISRIIVHYTIFVMLDLQR